MVWVPKNKKKNFLHKSEKCLSRDSNPGPCEKSRHANHWAKPERGFRVFPLRLWHSGQCARFLSQVRSSNPGRSVFHSLFPVFLTSFRAISWILGGVCLQKMVIYQGKVHHYHSLQHPHIAERLTTRKAKGNRLGLMVDFFQISMWSRTIISNAMISLSFEENNLWHIGPLFSFFEAWAFIWLSRQIGPERINHPPVHRCLKYMWRRECINFV